MELGVFVDRLQSELAVTASSATDEMRAAAERVAAGLDAATRLVLLEALSEAADAITRELAPGSVHVRLRGRDADFVVTPPPVPHAPQQDPAPAAPTEAEPADGPAARINFRPPEALKARIEEAAAQAGVSVNSWLVRTTTAALDRRGGPVPEGSSRNRVVGWAG
ncbi:toxin-antitoxin system HicB family antitoxin [Pseudonocardia sp. CA-107938]|uniref:toxin-antitoxin system HicB family antitoxin n=1 Tax=Pseudonocardia sp. CA-107938 TaxID=3240021 RepID=UPI003D9475C0